MENLTLEVYKPKAAHFILETIQNDRSYFVLGLLGELGELANILKKARRDGTLDRDAALLELGDVCWYAVYFTDLDNDYIARHSEDYAALWRMNQADALKYLDDQLALKREQEDVKGVRVPSLVEVTHAAISWSATVTHSLNHPYPMELFHLWRNLAAIAWHLDTSLSEVAEMNLAKLSERYQKEG